MIAVCRSTDAKRYLALCDLVSGGGHNLSGAVQNHNILDVLAKKRTRKRPSPLTTGHKWYPVIPEEFL